MSPTYRFRCPDHGNWDEWASITDDVSRAACPTCAASCKQVFTPPRISADATPTRLESVAATNRREKLWDKTMPAYQRLRANGVTPPTIDSSPELEARAETGLEIEMGKVYPLRKDRQTVLSAHEDIAG